MARDPGTVAYDRTRGAAAEMLGHAEELRRLSVQSLAWERAGAGLLRRLRAPHAARAVDVGCGPLGWLPLLNGWVGSAGRAIGTDVDDRLLAAARDAIRGAELANVEVVRDDLFDSQLAAGSFDLVHGRLVLAPLGSDARVLDPIVRLARPGGWIVLEEPDSGSWRFHPAAPATERLIDLLRAAFAAAGGDLDAGRVVAAMLEPAVVALRVNTHVRTLGPGHPYAAMPVALSRTLRKALSRLAGAAEVDSLLAAAEHETAQRRWAVTFTLVQAWGRRAPAAPTGAAVSGSVCHASAPTACFSAAALGDRQSIDRRYVPAVRGVPDVCFAGVSHPPIHMAPLAVRPPVVHP